MKETLINLMDSVTKSILNQSKLKKGNLDKLTCLIKLN